MGEKNQFKASTKCVPQDEQVTHFLFKGTLLTLILIHSKMLILYFQTHITGEFIGLKLLQIHDYTRQIIWALLRPNKFLHKLLQTSM